MADTNPISLSTEIVKLFELYCHLRGALARFNKYVSPASTVRHMIVRFSHLEMTEDLRMHSQSAQVEEWVTRLGTPALDSGWSHETSLSDIEALFSYDPDYVSAVFSATQSSIERRIAHVCNALRYRGVTDAQLEDMYENKKVEP